jgi:hypothetical protein
MRKLKMIIVALLVIIGILWLITLMLPASVTVSKTALIENKDSLVANQIEHFTNWSNWYPAFLGKKVTAITSQRDDTLFASLTDSAGQVLKIGLLKPAPNVIDIFFPTASGPESSFEFIIINKGANQTQLTWDVNTHLGWYPWRKIAGIFLDKMTAPFYEKSLDDLKHAAESN